MGGGEGVVALTDFRDGLLDRQRERLIKYKHTANRRYFYKPVKVLLALAFRR